MPGQRRMVSSKPAEARVLPSGLHVTPVNGVFWSLKVISGRPVIASQFAAFGGGRPDIWDSE